MQGEVKMLRNISERRKTMETCGCLLVRKPIEERVSAVSKYWSEIVKSIIPYKPGEQPEGNEFIKLNTNENPYPPSKRVLNAMQQAVEGDLRLYPDPTCFKLKEVASKYYNIPTDYIFVGNGSDEILAFCFKAFFNPKEKILFPNITYSFYEVYAALFDILYETVDLKDNFEIPIEAFFEKNKGIILANPNAPTGKILALSDIKLILDKNPDSVVIIDEAYIDFGGASAVEFISNYSNLLIIHTFSKSRSLAGLRVGLAMGHTDLIEGLNRVKNSFNSYTLDRVALAGAEQSLKDNEAFITNTNLIIHTRERISNDLRSIGFDVVDSKANFIFISHSKIPALEIFDELKKNKILVRYFNKSKIDNYLRVSIGTNNEMDRFYQVVQEILQSK